MSDSDGPGRREVAHRLFAAEFEDADLSYSESDEERAPNYVVTPSGARVNRLFVVGVLTEVEQVSEDVLRGRVVDPTGAFVLYAGQYQPDEQAFLDRAEPPMFVAVTGKARTFQPDDADTVYTSVRPETISEVDADTRDRWTVDAAERTLDRVATFAAAARMDERGDALASALGEQGVDDSLAEGIALALEHYGTTGTYLAALRELALDATRVVAGQREEVEPLTVDPGAGDDGALADLAADAEGAEEPMEPAAPTETGTEADAETTVPSTEEDGVESAETTAPVAGSTESTEAAESPETTVSGTAAGTGTAGASEAAGATAESPAGSDATTEDVGAATGTEAVDDADSGDIGDFEDSGLGDDEGEEDLDDFEPEEFELDEEEREEIEEEYGTDFQSGAEVDEPGEAGIETPESESEMTGTQSEEPAASAESELGPESEPAPGAEAEPEPEPETASEPDVGAEPDAGADAETGTDTETGGEAGAEGAEEGDSEVPAEAEELEGEELEDAVVDLMGDLDEGDGVAREELVDAATEQYGADAGAVEDTIQDALMGGRCYEPDDGTLKPI